MGIQKESSPSIQSLVFSAVGTRGAEGINPQPLLWSWWIHWVAQGEEPTAQQHRNWWSMMPLCTASLHQYSFSFSVFICWSHICCKRNLDCTSWIRRSISLVFCFFFLFTKLSDLKVLCVQHSLFAEAESPSVKNATGRDHDMTVTSQTQYNESMSNRPHWEYLVIVS